MSPETHMRLAEPFPPCAKSVRHFNGVTSIHGATIEDFEEDSWMTVVPCMGKHLDGWHDVNWAAMESRCPWASQYKFANMLKFGDLITLPDAVLGHKFLSHTMSTSRGEEQSTGTSGRESTNANSWSNHAHTKWFVDWCFAEDDEPMKPPCGPVIFVEDRKGRRVLGSVTGWQPSKNHDKRCYLMRVVYNSKGDVMAGAKGAILSWDLFQGFGGGALRTPFYTEVEEGGLVSAREFFDEVERSDFDLDDPCQISSDLELSLNVQMCSGLVSSGSVQPRQGKEMGSGGSVQPRQGEERGRFDDSEEEEEEDTRVSPQRLGDRGTLRIPGAERGATVVKQSWTSGGRLGLGSEDRTVGVVSGGEGGEQQSTQKRRGGSEGEASGAKTKQKTKTPQQSGGKRKGVEGHVGASSQKRPASAQKPPQSAPVQPRGVIDIDAAYFLEWKNGVRTKREFAINLSQVIDIGEWEAAYNQRSLDHVQIQAIIDAMTTAYSQTKKTYELPTLKLAPLRLVKPTPGVRADRLKPEDWKDELAGQYYYAVAGQHNAAAARALLGTDVAVRYNFERWPARMVYFSDEDFEGYFLVSGEDHKKDLKGPPKQLKLSMTDIRWCWKELGYPKAVMGNPSGKQAQVEAWRRFCAEVLHRTPYNHLWTLADDKTEQELKKQNAALRSYFPLAMAGKSALETGMEFFERWDTGRLLALEGAKWIAKKKKLQGLKPGDDLRENTSVVYDARLAAGDAAAVGPLQKVTPAEISDMPFDACEWPVVIHGRDPVVYKGHERNTTQFARLLEFLCKKGDSIMFLGKAHAQVVWEVLKGGRNVIALEGNSEWLLFTLNFLKTAVNSGAYRCEFITKSEKPRRVWDPSTDMWFKLSARKRSRIYEFLFLEKRPGRGTDIEYMRRKEHMLALLDNYHGATRLNAKNFLDRLELLYFVESEPVLRLESYGALIDADEESLTSVVLDTGAPEEDSDTEEIDIDYRLAPVLPSPPPRHDHTRSTEADWGHDMIWHPGTIEPTIRKGEWVMAIVDTDGEWKPSERLAKSDYLDIVRSAVLDKVTLENSNLQPADPAIIATADRLFRELHDKQWLELSDDFYDLETSPSKKKVNWKVPPSTGTQGSVGGGPPTPPGAGGGGGSGHEEGGGGGSGHTTSGGSAPTSSLAPGGQGRIAHSGVGEGGVNVTHSPTARSGKLGKFTRIRTSQTEDPVPMEAAKSVGICTSTTLEQAALPSWTAFGSSSEVGRGSCAGDPVSAVKGKSAGIPTGADDV
ncbi:hypothetical protein CBR_g52092 [Chara braunii]|uniref:Uncharacterized protein n=1 Tax=Chara braunii TaxID=69332 RepID=A0A388M9I2_CHABU|nr:hypothetical protein CBR_g52092 [Chara braunii]|eukprot:GBG91210.1 hypothetical protein CBR_g52092 [Chara braunii]